jgi:hypothetical protein
MRTRHLLTAGMVAGPLFVTVVSLQLLTRDGFDITHHPISLLTLGPGGWVQVANFVTAGVLSGAFAVGMSRALVSGPGCRWVPRLLFLYGAGLAAGGLFRPDPALGYPVGTPDEVPDEWSWHAWLHAVAPPLAFTALVAAAVVLARRDWVLGRRGWSLCSSATAAAALLLAAWPHPDSSSWRLALGVAVGFAWLTGFAARERGRLVARTTGSRALAA